MFQIERSLQCSSEVKSEWDDFLDSQCPPEPLEDMLAKIPPVSDVIDDFVLVTSAGARLEELFQRIDAEMQRSAEIAKTL